MEKSRRVFLDCNVLVDFLETGRQRHLECLKLVRYLTNNSVEVYFSEDMLSTIYYIVEDKERCLEFFSKILFLWKIVSFGLDVVKSAIEQSLKRGIDFEDLLQCLCAIENNCDVFITNDKSIPNSNILVHSYEDFFEREKVKS